jgi:folate-binding protein YgfZ
MSSATESASTRIALTDMGVIHVAGGDAREFLQGQVSNDLLRLTSEKSLLAALNTAQGRVVAVLRLVQRMDGIFVAVPLSLVSKVIAALGRYVLRSKVVLSDESARLAVVGVLGADTRQLILVPRAELTALAPASAPQRWRLASIEAGEPQVHLETSEMFVAQMLNLDLVDGVSFTKGCYTGQEIIARTQHRGRIKRRMLRYRVRGGALPGRGEQVLLDSRRIGRVVESAARNADESEILAVVPLDASDRDSADSSLPRLQIERLPLPYDVPDLA